MTWLEEIRKQFGFSQQTLAGYLSVTVSLLKMVEKDHRSLPTSALLKLAQLQLAVPNMDAATPAASVSNTPTPKNVHPLLHAHAKQQVVKAELHRRKLADMQGKHQQAINKLAMVTELGKQLPNGDDGKKDELWLAWQQEEAKAMVRKNGPESQSLLQWKIDCMAFAAERATAIINGQ